MSNKNNSLPLQQDWNRREFITSTSKAFAATLVLSSPLISLAKTNAKDITVGEIMDAFIKDVPGAPFANTVDTLKAGNRSIKVTGVVTSMFATVEVITKTIAAGANFIIAHEPTFYNHTDETAWLENDEVYQYKKNLLQQNNIAVWRNHDYIHSHKPDGVFSEVAAKLGWTNYFSAGSNVATVPSISLKDLIDQVKKQLGIEKLRYIGNLSQSCKKILLMPGAAGGRRQIQNMSKEKPDVLICGEIQEWETAEYVRDAQTKGQQLSLIVLGHIVSEEPGSAYMAEWLRKKIPNLPVTHIPAGHSLSFL